MAMNLGTNLAPFVQGTAERPFLNEFKSGGGWFTYNGSTETSEEVNLYKTALDANGYCTSLAGFTATSLLATVHLANTTYPSGVWVFLADLNGGTPAFNFTTNSDVTSVDSTNAASGRWLLSVTSGSGLGICIRQTTIGSPHPTNFRLVYSPDSTAGTGGGTVVGINGVGTREALLNGGEVFNPDFISRISSFQCLRFMNWMAVQSSFIANWSDRRSQNWVFWSDSPTNATINGGPPSPFFGGMNDGVPAEVLFSLCNRIGADGWFCMPPLSTTGAAGGTSYVYQFAALAHSSLNPGLKAYVEYANELWNLKLAGATGTMTQTVVQQVSALAVAAYPGYVGSDYQKNTLYSFLRAVQDGATWKTAWGADSARAVRVWGGQNGNDAGYNQNWLPLTDAAAGGGSHFTGTLAANIDAMAVAPYFSAYTNDLPTAWNSNLVTGLPLAYAAINGTNPIPTTSGGRTTAGTSTAYTLTSGQALSGTPPNGTLTSCTFHAACGTSPQIVVDTCTSFPLVFGSATALTAGQIATSDTWALCFNASTLSWQVINCWVSPNNAQYAISTVVGWINSNVATAASPSYGNGIACIGYEGGQQFVATAGSVTDSFYESFNLSSYMGQAYTSLLTQAQTSGMTLFNHFYDVGYHSNGEYWGSLEDVTTTSSPKYDALANFIAAAALKYPAVGAFFNFLGVI